MIEQTEPNRRQVMVTETVFDEDDTKRYYTFPLPVALGKGYRQVLSYNAFFHGSRRRANWTDKRLFSPAIVGADPVPEHTGETREFMDIYEFFKVIGYNYRNKRYVNGERIQPLARVHT